MKSLKQPAVTTKALHACEISRVEVAGTVTAGNGFLRKGTLRVLAVLALIVATSPVLAASTQASGEQATKASAGLDFRIVIPETLHINSEAQRRARSQPVISRTTEVAAGRTVVTVARP